MSKLAPRSFCTFPYPDKGEVESEENEIKFALHGYRQADGYSCAATASWPIVQHFYPQSSFRKFYRDCRITSDGCYDNQLIRALRKNGLGVSVKIDLTCQEIYDTINKGFPILARIMHGKSETEEGIPHWVLIYGVSAGKIYTMNNYISGDHGRAEFTWNQWEEIVDKESNFLTCWGKK